MSLEGISHQHGVGMSNAFEIVTIPLVAIVGVVQNNNDNYF